MVTKETKNFKTVETLRERERESLNLSQLGFDKCAQNDNESENTNDKKIDKNVSNIIIEYIAFSNVCSDKSQTNIMDKLKDRLECSRYLKKFTT